MYKIDRRERGVQKSFSRNIPPEVQLISQVLKAIYISNLEDQLISQILWIYDISNFED